MTTTTTTSTCKYCNGIPPNRIGMFENSTEVGIQCVPMRYKMCDHCKKIDTFNYLDRFYNKTTSRIVGYHFWKIWNEKKS